MTIQERIKKVRKDSCLSQEEFSASIGQKRANYSQVELGNQLPSIAMISSIARIYGISHAWIIDGKEFQKGAHSKSSSDAHPSAHPSAHLMVQEENKQYIISQKSLTHTDHIVDLRGNQL